MGRNRLPWLPRFIFSPGNAWSILTILHVTKHCVGKFWEMRTSRSGPGLSVLSTALILTACPLRQGISSVFPPEALLSKRAGNMLYFCSAQCPRHHRHQVNAYYWLWRKCWLIQSSNDNYINALLSDLSDNEMTQIWKLKKKHSICTPSKNKEVANSNLVTLRNFYAN